MDSTEPKKNNILRPVRKVGVCQSSANLVNAVIGIGVLGIPKQMDKSGIVMGLSLLFFVCIIGDFVSIKLIKMAKIEKVDSYEKLSQRAWGNGLFYVTCVFNFLFPFGSLTGYVNLIKNTTTAVISYFFPMVAKKYPFVSYLITFGLFLCIIVPLSLLKDLAMLSWSSVISVLIFGVIIIITAVTGMRYGQMRTYFGPKEYTSFLSSIGTLSFALVCVDCLLPIYVGLRDHSQKRWNKVTHISIWSLGGIYALFSTICYLLIPDLDDYVLNSPSITDRLEIVISKILLTVMILITYPVVLHVSRSYIFSMFEPHIGEIKELSNRRFYFMHYSVTLTILGLSMIIGMFTKKLGIIISLTGLMSSTVVGFVIPVMIIFRIRTFKSVWREFKTSFRRNIPAKKRMVFAYSFLFPVVIFGFGLIGFLIGTPFVILKFTKKLNSTN